MTTMRRCLAIVMPSLILLILAGCGSGVPPRSAALDPSNANGPESPPFNASPGLPESAGGENVIRAPNRADGSEQHAGHGHAGNAEAMPASSPAATTQAGSSGQSATYTCPMHPEVTSAQPGKCPKCGMNLVPKKADQ